VLPAPRRVRDWDARQAAGARQACRGELLLEVDQVRKEFGGLIAVNDVRSTSAPRHLGLIAQRRGQVDDLQPDHRVLR